MAGMHLRCIRSSSSLRSQSRIFIHDFDIARHSRSASSQPHTEVTKNVTGKPPLKRLAPGDLGLMTPIHVYDSAIVETIETRGRRGTVILRNEESMRLFKTNPKDEAYNSQKTLDNDPKLILPTQKNLHRYRLVRRIVKQQTGKGKIARHYCLTVVGNGNGLVGYGEGKHDDAGYAAERSYIEAVRNMDYVERFESRTIWTDITTKLGATQIIMRPRPVGFGLRCNPNVHQVLKAAGVKDVSAKVWGSRNPINVIKATIRMISSGYAVPSMGNGVGGGGKKLEKGSGMRSKEAIERERGRRLVDGRL